MTLYVESKPKANRRQGGSGFGAAAWQGRASFGANRTIRPENMYRISTKKKLCQLFAGSTKNMF